MIFAVGEERVKKLLGKLQEARLAKEKGLQSAAVAYLEDVECYANSLRMYANEEIRKLKRNATKRNERKK